MNRAERWVEEILTTKSNETLHELGENFKCMLDDVEAYESGDLGFEDLPNFEKMDRMLIKICTDLGASLLATTSELYEVTDDTGLVSVTTDKNSAEETASNLEEGNVRTISIEAELSPQDIINEMKEKNESMKDVAEDIEEVVQWIRENISFGYGSVSEKRVPFSDDDLKMLICYSVLFGMLFEASYPGVYIVSDRNGVVRAVWTGEEPMTGPKTQVRHLRKDSEV